MKGKSGQVPKFKSGQNNRKSCLVRTSYFTLTKVHHQPSPCLIGKGYIFCVLVLLRIAGIICTGNSVNGILSFLIQLMSQSNFLTTLQSFPKDTINDEMVELLAPYLEMEDYNMETAKRVCSSNNERSKFILWQHHGVCQCLDCLGAFHWAKPTDHKWNNTVVLSQGALVIQPKLSKIWKQRQMVQKFPGNISRNSGNFWISETRTIQPKILELPAATLNGKKTCGKIFFFFCGNAVPFATASCRKFQPVVLVEWKAP